MQVVAAVSLRLKTGFRELKQDLTFFLQRNLSTELISGMNSGSFRRWTEQLIETYHKTGHERNTEIRAGVGGGGVLAGVQPGSHKTILGRVNAPCIEKGRQ
jgi:hypothetical protein